jgi:hypothetical protein
MNGDYRMDLPGALRGLDEQMVNAALREANRSPSIQLSAMGFQVKARDEHSRYDASLTLDFNGVAQHYQIEAKNHIRGLAEISTIAQGKRHTAVPILLITPHLTPTQAEECVLHDLQFLDLAGNMYLHAPGQQALVIGRSASAEIKLLKRAADRSSISASASALRMIFTFLCEPGFINKPYREIAAAAGVALGTIGPVLDDLRQRRLLTGADHSHGRRILDRKALRDEWLISYPLRLLPKLNTQRFTAPDPLWWEGAQISAGAAWWGGEIAAAKLSGQLRPITQTLYVKPAVRQELLFGLVKQHRLRADPVGAFEIIDTFWDFGGTTAHKTIVPPLLIYADLVRTREPRNLELASLIFEGMERADESDFS